MAPQATKDAIKDATGHTYNSVKQAGWVASKFESGTRVPNVSWAHHREVAALPLDEARPLLEEAAEAELSTRDLGDKAKACKRALTREAALAQPVPELDAR